MLQITVFTLDWSTIQTAVLDATLKINLFSRPIHIWGRPVTFLNVIFGKFNKIIDTRGTSLKSTLYFMIWK